MRPRRAPRSRAVVAFSRNYQLICFAVAPSIVELCEFGSVEAVVITTVSWSAWKPKPGAPRPISGTV